MAQETIEIKVKSNIPEVNNEAKSYRKQIRELKKQLDTLDQSSLAYTETLAKLAQTTADYKDELMYINNAVGDFDGVLTNLTKIGADVAAGFNVATAAQALFGSNFEALEKTMVKFQAALAMLAGLKGLQGLSKDLKSVTISIKAMTTGFKGAGSAAGVFKASLKGIKTAIAETGIGLLVIAVAALISNWKTIAKLFGYTTPEEKAAEATKKFNDELEKLDNNLNTASDEALVKYTQALKDANGDAEAIAKATAEYNKEVLEAQYNHAVETTNMYQQKLTELKADYARETNKKEKERIANDIKAAQKGYDESYTNQLQYQNKMVLNDANAQAEKTKNQKEAAKKQVEIAKTTAKEKAEADIQERESIRKTIIEYKKLIAEIIELYETRKKYLSKSPEVQPDTSTPVPSTKSEPSSEELRNMAQTAVKLREIYDTESEASRKREADAKKDKEYYENQLKQYTKGSTEYKKYSDKIKEIDKDIRKEQQFQADQYVEYQKSMNRLVADGWPVEADTLTEGFVKFKKKVNDYQELYKSGLIDESTMGEAVHALTEQYKDSVDKVTSSIEGISTKNIEALKKALSAGNLDVEFADTITETIENYTLSQIDKISAEVEKKLFDKTDEIQAKVWERFKKKQAEDKENWVDTIDVKANFGEGLVDFLQSYVQPVVHQTYQQMYQEEQKHADAIYEANKAQLQAIVDGADEKLKIDTLTAEQKLEIEREKTDAQIQLQDLEVQHYEESVNRKNELDAKRQEVMKRSIQVASTMFSNLANLSQQNANDETKSQASREKSFKKYKKLKKASAIIDTFQAANEAYASMASIPYVGPALGAAAAAAAIIAGIANVKAIDQEKFSGSSASSSNTPDVNASLMNGDANSSLLSDESNYDINSVQPETKVYVTESDITGTQNNVETKVRESTF